MKQRGGACAAPLYGPEPHNTEVIDSRLRLPCTSVTVRFSRRWSYPSLADKEVAFVIHANWMPTRHKKTRLLRDNLWFLAGGDARCAIGFDPYEHGCNKHCRPVLRAEPGSSSLSLKSCDTLRREDERHMKRHRLQQSQTGNGTLRSAVAWQYWHPLAYDGSSCSRNGSRMGALSRALRAMPK